MPVKRFRPLTPSLRFKIADDRSQLSKVAPEKSLLIPTSKTGGRNSNGKMTMRYRGGGHKQMLRVIDFKRNKHDIPARVASLEYDPNRTAWVALLHYVDGEKRYILAPRGIKVGQSVMSGPSATPDLGNAMLLKDIPLGSAIHNIEIPR